MSGIFSRSLCFILSRPTKYFINGRELKLLCFWIVFDAGVILYGPLNNLLLMIFPALKSHMKSPGYHGYKS